MPISSELSTIALALIYSRSEAPRVTISCPGFVFLASYLGLRVRGFERRATIAFVITVDRVVIEGIYYGGQDLDANFGIEPSQE